jgi:putative nucleotidyltransferase with HDIG domain
MAQAMTRAELDRLLVSSDPAAGLRVALADGQFDALIPEIRREMDFPQRTRWHHLTNLEHSLETTAGVPAELDERLAALFHDIGKRRTTSIKPSTGEEQYLGHAGVGAEMTRAILERLVYEQELIDRVCRWIARHMDLHMAARDGHSDRARRKLLGKLGDDFEVLARLQLADIHAMNPAIREEKLREAHAYQHRLRADLAAKAG